MKRILASFLVALVLIGLMPIAGCQKDDTGTHTQIPVKLTDMHNVKQEAPDDYVLTTGGGTYRANLHQEGVENPWPPIESVDTILGNGPNAINVSYRQYIETPVGETRNNIIRVTKEGESIDSKLKLYTSNIPIGMSLGAAVGLPGTSGTMLVIEIASDISPGKYPLEIGLIIDGKDYGTVTCTVSVFTQSLNSINPDHAKPYMVVGNGNLASDDPNRSVGLWFITSENASGFEEYAQTAIQAAIDLYSLYRNDFTEVLLIPQPSVTTPYAQAFYASDGKGAWGMTGSVPAVPKYWYARAMGDIPYNTQELTILELWQKKQVDFPNQDLLSSLSYDETALRQYISDTLNIPYSETQVRQLKTVEYKVPDESLEEEVPVVPVSMPPKVAALQALVIPVEFTAAEQVSISALVNDVPQELRNQFAIIYEAALEAAKDPHWGMFSSWRPYTQSSEYLQLLEFCQERGQAVWPLLFQQLDSEPPYFAGGLILDITIPEYLYYFEDTGASAKPDMLVYIKELMALFQRGNYEK